MTAAAHFPPLCDYYIVQGSSPGTQAWSIVQGMFVPWSDATLATFLSSGLAQNQAAFASWYNIISCSSASGGAATSLQVSDTGQFTNNQKWNVSGTGLYDGNQIITILDATHVTIPVAFAGNATGFLAGAAFVATAALLNNALRASGLSVIPTTSGFYSANFITTGVNLTMSNPMAVSIIIKATASVGITLPPMNQANSIPVGVPVSITNDVGSGSFAVVLTLNDGTSFPILGVSNSLPGGSTVWFVNLDNGSANGTLKVLGIFPQGTVLPTSLGGTGTGTLPAGVVLAGNPMTSQNPLSVGLGGTGDTTLTVHGVLLGEGASAIVATAAMTNGQLLVGQTGADPLPKTITGDVTLTAAGASALGNIPNDTTMAGDLLATNIVFPSSPPAGTSRIYVDSTSKNLAVKNDAGTVNHGVQTKAAVAHNFLTAIADDGSSTLAQPAFTDISGTAQVAQGGTGATKYNACRMYLNVNQTGNINGTWTKINVDTVDFDADSIASTVNHRITPNMAGTYLVSVACHVQETGATTSMGATGVSIAKNGSRVRIMYATLATANADAGVFNCTDIVPMNGTTDFLEVQAISVNTGGTNWLANAGSDETWLSVVRVGP